ncbi:MAG: hypothetical protein IJY03_04425 [Prevotella sp.]|nr:hypothetical protein [Prevotella sp.]
MKLKHITFTGIDAMSDIKTLQGIQKEFPLAEFGVLTSYHWNENGNRYLDPELIAMLRGKELRLSLHICGSAAHDAAVKEWEKIDELTKDSLDIFKRVQLNLSGRKDNPEYCWIPLVIGQELIIQQKGHNNLALYESTLNHWKGKPYPHRDVISVLLDASGGRGIDTPIDILETKEKVGYAGGMNPENVGDKLYQLLTSPKVGDFWIDMESGVRTDDWFDLDKVHRVLSICKEVIRDCNHV